jgi:hypothetical protein
MPITLLLHHLMTDRMTRPIRESRRTYAYSALRDQKSTVALNRMNRGIRMLVGRK